MQYKNVVRGIFLKRLNRFTAEVSLNEKTLLVHVKNTGRLKELLIPGTVCGLCKAENPERKTAYDLISVLHNGFWVNIDSSAPNTVAGEFLKNGGLGKVESIKPEQVYSVPGSLERSRFDFFAQFEDGTGAYIEVKGVTLVEDGVAKFPDAPTTRGARHVRTLADCVNQGFKAYVLFVIQRKDATAFTPHDKQDADFAKALRYAAKAGVCVKAIDCVVTEDTLRPDQLIEIRL